MKYLVYLAIVLTVACGPQQALELHFEPSELHYWITPTQTGFHVRLQALADHPSRLILNESLQSDGFQARYSKPGEIEYHVSPKKHAEHVQVQAHNEIYFQSVGGRFLACYHQNPKSKKQIHLHWQIPADWKLANSFGSNYRDQHFEASCEELGQSLFLGGPNLRLERTEFGTLALNNQFSDQATSKLINLLNQNMARVENFWGEKPYQGYFLVAAHTNSQQQAGSAHFNAFQLQLLPNALYQKEKELNQLIAHEYFHQWNPFALNHPADSNGYNLDMRWFTEGFTDYYAYLLTGTEPSEDKLPQNKPLDDIKGHYQSQVLKNQPPHNDYFHLPYKQGLMLASLFDINIQQSNSKRSLQDVMHEILRRSKADPGYLLTQQNFLDVICEGNYINCEDAKSLVQRHVIKGEPFPYLQVKYQADPLVLLTPFQLASSISWSQNRKI